MDEIEVEFIKDSPSQSFFLVEMVEEMERMHTVSLEHQFLRVKSQCRLLLLVN